MRRCKSIGLHYHLESHTLLTLLGSVVISERRAGVTGDELKRLPPFFPQDTYDRPYNVSARE